MRIEIDLAAQHDHLAHVPCHGLVLQREDAQILSGEATHDPTGRRVGGSPVAGRRGHIADDTIAPASVYNNRTPVRPTPPGTAAPGVLRAPPGLNSELRHPAARVDRVHGRVYRLPLMAAFLLPGTVASTPRACSVRRRCRSRYGRRCQLGPSSRLQSEAPYARVGVWLQAGSGFASVSGRSSAARIGTPAAA